MAKVGSKAGWHGNYVESISAAKTIVTGDSGKVFMVTDTGASGYTITLPTPANAGIGFTAKFINNCTAGGTLNGSGGEDVVLNDGQTDVMVSVHVDQDSDVVSDSQADTVGFDHTSVKGDTLEIFSDGTIWFVYGRSGAAAGIIVAT